MQDLSQLVAASTGKPNAQVIGRGSMHHKRRSNARYSTVRKQNRPSALSHGQPLSGNCDDVQVGIRTRRMSAADACTNKKLANQAATEIMDEDTCSLSSASTAPATNVQTEVTGLVFFV